MAEREEIVCLYLTDEAEICLRNWALNLSDERVRDLEEMIASRTGVEKMLLSYAFGKALSLGGIHTLKRDGL